jgi:hypothetical protein
MKKKSSAFILVLIAFLVFSNTGYAKVVSKKITAVFGSYLVKVNGKTQTTETLANGSKVYIPITDLTKLTGTAVKKTGTTYAITPVVKEDGITKKHVDAVKKELTLVKKNHQDVKIMVQFMDTYKNLDDFQDSLNYLNDFLAYAYYDIKVSKDMSKLNATEAFYNEMVGDLTHISNDFNADAKMADSKGFSTADDKTLVADIDSDYDSALKLMSESINLLKLYAQNSQESDADQCFEKVQNALDIGSEAQDKAYDVYLYYLDEVSSR